MPGPKTHDIFYKQLKQKLKSETLSDLPNYDKYNIFAQGHDFLIYHNFYKIWNQKRLDKNVSNSTLLQEYDFQKFVYNFLKEAKNNGAIEEEQTRLFIGAGYIMHHLLDAYTHPQIIYYCGDHERDPKNETWKHGIVENLIDIYMMKTREGIDPKSYPVHKDFEIEFDISSKLIDTLNVSLYETYNIQNGGNTFSESFNQVALFMKTMKYDPTGLKKVLFDAADPILKGTSSFSYNRNCDDVVQYLNNEHDIWLNPMNKNIISNNSFDETYNIMLSYGAYIINQLEKICKSGIINQDDIFALIPNIASTHGLECGQKLKILNKRR